MESPLLLSDWLRDFVTAIKVSSDWNSTVVVVVVVVVVEGGVLGDRASVDFDFNDSLKEEPEGGRGRGEREVELRDL